MLQQSKYSCRGSCYNVTDTVEEQACQEIETVPRAHEATVWRDVHEARARPGGPLQGEALTERRYAELCDKVMAHWNKGPDFVRSVDVIYC